MSFLQALRGRNIIGRTPKVMWSTLCYQCRSGQEYRGLRGARFRVRLLCAEGFME